MLQETPRALAVLLGAACLAVLCPDGRGAAAQEMSKDQQKCTNALNKDLAKIAATASKNIQACVKDYQKGKTANLGPDGTAEGCLTADVKGKLAKAQAKLRQDWDKKCTGTDKNNDPRLPDWGVTDPNTVDDMAVEKELFLVRDVFGSDLDLNLGLEKDPSKCQQGVFKDTLKCQDAILKEFTKCKKDGLKGKSGSPFTSGADLAGCLGADPKGKVAKACDDPAKPDKIRKDIDKKCVAKGVDLSTAFPGCDTDDPAQLHDCLQKAAECRSCAALKLADGFDATCSACIPSGPLGTFTCTYDSRSWCVGGVRDGLPCTDGLANTDCGPAGPDRGNCLSLSPAVYYSFAGPLFDVTQFTQIRFEAGAPDPVTGLAPVECRIDYAEGMDFGPLIGWACQFDRPGCPRSVGQLDCDGGEPLDKRFETDHNIGDCGIGDDPNETDPNNLTGASECRTQCEAYCSSLPGSFGVYKSLCEGYCVGGDMDGTQCHNDIECFATDPNLVLSHSGECAGGEPVAHGNRCQCQCGEVGGGPSRPGAFQCQVGNVTSLEADWPCDGLDITMFTRNCVPITTETIDLTLRNMDAVPGRTLTLPTLQGWPASCQQMVRNNMGTLSYVGDTFATDGGLGDSAQASTLHCQGPGYDLGP